MPKEDRTVFPRSDGMWVNKVESTEEATSVHDTEAEAVEAARQSIKKAGGGELTIMGEDGQVRSTETVSGAG